MEKIGDIDIDYTFYYGNDEYSDGDVEDSLLDIVKNNIEYDKIVEETDDFAIYYHLSKTREFITEMMDIKNKDSVLEIGSGCGAITGALANKSQFVTCIELSKKRSLINAYKNRKCDNVKIYVGNYKDIKLKEKYDVVTLIGVFEYSLYYFGDANPYENMLKSCMDKLNANGRLYIAIENRLGAKYFSGCREDHTGKVFEGIEGYPESINARTFSYYELIEMFEKLGLNKYEFYYPYPDYKFPHVIYSDEYLPNKNVNFELASDYKYTRNRYFDENRFLRSLVMEKEFKLFSNSYLVCIRK